MQVASIAKGDVLQRMAGISFIVSGILILVLYTMFPRASDPASTKSWLEAWANAGSSFKVIALLSAVGMWALLIGVVGIYRAHNVGAAAAWTRLGFYGVLVGTVLWTLISVNQIGLSSVLADWGKSSEPAKTALYQAAFSHVEMTNTLYSMNTIVYWLALTFVGIGMVLGAVYPKWLSWVLTILGGVTVVAVGIPNTLAGIGSVTNILIAIVASLTFLWALVTGIWLVRKAW